MVALTLEQKIVYELSERIVQAQRPIRILDALKWDNSIKDEFFRKQCKELPAVDKEYYEKNPLSFAPEQKQEEFYLIERDIRSKLGQYNIVGKIMQRMCREYREVIRMLQVRGTSEFSNLAQQLYGSSNDVFHIGAPTLKDLAELVSTALTNLKGKIAVHIADEKIYSSEEAVNILGKRLGDYFQDAKQPIRVVLSDGIMADAAAGAELIRIRHGASFSERDLKILEVHEGWVHLGTTLNGTAQPICTFLSKGPPSSTQTQEGLATLIEIFTFASYPGRVQRLTNRITAIHMAEEGANFLEVFEFLCFQGLSAEESYANAMRVFRGSLPDKGPFTKDLAYSKGFILIYNFIRLAIQQGSIAHIPLLFLGKTTLEDIGALAELVQEGWVVAPKYLPEQFKDPAALSAWMCYSLFLNRINLQQLASEYKDIL